MILEKEEKLAQLDKILQSQTLQSSENLRAFLRFVVLKSLEEQGFQLKEYTIATEVFGRNSKYDPRTDSVVRVQAGRLRSKLQEYYATEGKDDRVLIDLPKGHYSPSFSYIKTKNGTKAQSEEKEPVLTATPQPVEAVPLPRARWPGRIALASVVLSVLLSALTIEIWTENRRLKSVVSSVAGGATDFQPPPEIWADMLSSTDPILVAYSNTIFEGRPETGMKLLKPLDSNAPNFGSVPVPQKTGSAEADSMAISDHYTGVGEVMGVYALGNFFWRSHRPFKVKRSLLLTWDDLKTEDIVMLGSPAENLLLRDLPQKQDFVFHVLKDNKHGYGIVNLRPLPGEQQVYVGREDGPSTSQLVEDYALVSLLKGLDEKHRLLILAGISTFGTQAAAEYVTNPEYFNELGTYLRASRTSSGGAPRYCQVLLKVKINGGVPVQISYVTHHVLE